MSCEDLLGNVHTKGQFVASSVVLKLTIDWNEAWVVTSDYLVLDKAFLEGVTFLVRGGLLFEDFHQRLVNLIVMLLMHFRCKLYIVLPMQALRLVIAGRQYHSRFILGWISLHYYHNKPTTAARTSRGGLELRLNRTTSNETMRHLMIVQSIANVTYCSEGYHMMDSSAVSLPTRLR